MKIKISPIVLIISVILAGCMVIMLPIDFSLKHKNAIVDLKIIATGNRNQAAKGSEVWIQSIDGIKLTKNLLGKDWNLRNEEIFSHQNQPNVFEYKGVLPVNSKISLTKHDWSGIAEISLNGVNEVIDLYSINPQTLTLPLINKNTVYKNEYKPTSNFLFKLLILIIIFIVSYALFTFYNYRPFIFSVRKFKNRLPFGLPMFLMGTLSLVAFFPAQMSPDSIDQWSQILNGHWNNGHPVISSWLVWPLVQIWSTPAWLPILQVLALSTVLNYFLNELRNWGIKDKYIWISALIFAIVPFNFMLVTHFWKDILFSISILLTTALLLKFYRTGGAISTNRIWFWLFLFSQFYTSISRHNGFIVSAITIIGIIFFCNNFRLYFIKIGIIIISLVASFNFLLLPLAKVEPIPNHAKSIFAVHGLAVYLNAKNTISDNELNEIKNAIPIDQWKKLYDCRTVVPLFWNQYINYRYLAENYNNLNKILIREILSNPLPMLSHQVCVTSMLWRVLPKDGDSMYTVIGGIDQGALKIFKLSIPQADSPLKNSLYKYSQYSYEHLTILWRPALYLLILLIIYFSLATSLKKFNIFIIFLPVLGNTLSLALFMQSPDLRYQWCVLIVTIACLPLLYRHPVKESPPISRL